MKPTYALRGSTAWLSLDDGKANAMRIENLELLDRYLDRARDDGARAIVFRGRDGIFSGGLDLKWLPTLDRAEMRQLARVFSRVMLRVLASPIPTVALVSGHAIAGGCILTCACDRRIGLAGDYRMQMNEVLLRIPVPRWAALIVSSVLTAPALYDVLQLAVPLRFERALSLGVLHALADGPEALDRMGVEVAAELSLLDPAAFGATKQTLWAEEIARAERALERE